MIGFSVSSTPDLSLRYRHRVVKEKITYWVISEKYELKYLSLRAFNEPKTLISIKPRILELSKISPKSIDQDLTKFVTQLKTEFNDGLHALSLDLGAS